MSAQTDQQLRFLTEKLGRLQRRTEHLERELELRTESHHQINPLPYSKEENDANVQDVGFSEDIENALHRNNVFMISEILDLGKRWLDNAPGIGAGRAEEIKIHLAGMGVALPD